MAPQSAARPIVPLDDRGREIPMWQYTHIMRVGTIDSNLAGDHVSAPQEDPSKDGAGVNSRCVRSVAHGPSPVQLECQGVHTVGLTIYGRFFQRA